MIHYYGGKITEDLHAIGYPRSPAILVAAERPAIFDAGVSIMGPFYIEDLKRILGDPGKLRYVFLTHAHYDHCGSAPYLKKKIPGLKAGASQIAADILARPNAVALIRNLNRDIPDGLPRDELDPEAEFDSLVIDMALESGQEFDLGKDLSFQVIATPCHTRDSVSYYFPGAKVLITGEAAGVLDTALKVVPEFVSSYSDYLASLQKMAELDTEYLLLGHGFYVTGEDVKTYWRNSIRATEAFRNKTLKYMDSFHGNQAAVVEQIYQEEYVATGTNLQPAGAYLINLEAKVRTIVRER